VTVQPVQGGSKALPFLLNGSLDVAFGNYVSFLPAQAHGAARLRILAEGCVAGPSLEVVLAMPGSGIKTVAAGWRSAGLARVPGLG
jgi:NitT/TauT family transport system substrate-binding protein